MNGLNRAGVVATDSIVLVPLSELDNRPKHFRAKTNTH